MTDGLSAMHEEAVWAELQGRFFSKEEAARLIEEIERRIFTDPAIRAEAAKAWGVRK